MPLNGGGTASKPPGTTFVPNTTIQSSPVNSVIDDIYAIFNTPRPIAYGGTNGIDIASAQANLNLVGYNAQTLTAAQQAQARVNIGVGGYATKSANYTAALSDGGSTINFTAAATLALTAASTLGPSWEITVIAGGGDIIVDPNGAETINGLATLLIPRGSTASVICDGTGFFTFVNPSPWVTIAKQSFTGTTFSLVGLSAFERILIKANITQTSAAINLRTSTNNGVSYDSGASDYTTLSSGASTTAGGTPINTTATSTSINLTTGNSVTDFNMNVCIEGFNKAAVCDVNGLVRYNSGPLVIVNINGRRVQATARNALQIISGASMAGTIVVEGQMG